MRKPVKVIAYSLAVFLLLDTILALFGLPSLISSDELSGDRSAIVAMALLAIGALIVIARPNPAGIAFNTGALAGSISTQHERDLATFTWIAVSLLITAIAISDFLAEVRCVRLDAIHARIDEEIVDGSLIHNDVSSTSV
jgi:low affinity Fe/Cu permease